MEGTNPGIAFKGKHSACLCTWPWYRMSGPLFRSLGLHVQFVTICTGIQYLYRLRIEALGFAETASQHFAKAAETLVAVTALSAQLSSRYKFSVVPDRYNS